MSARRAPRSPRGHLSRHDMLLTSARDLSRSFRMLLHELIIKARFACRFLLDRLIGLVARAGGVMLLLLRHLLWAALKAYAASRLLLRRLATGMKGAYWFLRRHLFEPAVKTIKAAGRFLWRPLRRLAVKMLASAFNAFSAGFVAGAAAVSLWQLALIALGRSNRFEPLQVLVYALLSGAAAAVLFGTLMRKYSKLFPREEEKGAKGGGGESPEGGEGGTAE